MARRELSVTTAWQVASNRAALFEIIQEPQIANAQILFNDAESDTAAERIGPGNKGLQILQPLDVTTYVKARQNGYTIVIED
jgi:hypothetical protein